MIADRLVHELMLVSVVVAGEGAAALAATLAAAGTAAEVFGPAVAGGFDLAILLAPPEAAGRPGMAETVAALAGVSDRLLFAPLPLRIADNDDSGRHEGGPALPALTQWFEIFAEHGFQPVVDFDAGFVAAGAFLVDRAATAAESELAAFAERLQQAPAAAPAPPPAAAAADPASGELPALRAALAERDAQISALAAQGARFADALRDAETRNAGWDGLRLWVNMVVADPWRDSRDALLRDLPRINALRAPAPPLALPPAPQPARPRLLDRLLGRPHRTAAPSPVPLLEDTALVRASRLFDAAWYIASSADLIEGEAIDPVFHYVLVGALRGADPGPWFDTQAYLAAHPEAGGGCALVHAIRTGAVADMQSG